MTSHAGRDAPQDFQSAHRLRTVSAAEALKKLGSNDAVTYSTGIASLDDIFAEGAKDIQPGLPRGAVTEIFGPPGVGKTSFGLQLAANVLSQKKAVVWIDAASSFTRRRLNDMLERQLALDKHTNDTTPAADLQDALSRVKHILCPSVAHLLMYFLHPAPDLSFFMRSCSLIIIDNVTVPLNAQFTGPHKLPTDPGTREMIQFAASRRWSIIADLISAISKLAATNDIPLVLLSQVTTKVRAETGAILRAAVESDSWETGISNRIVLFRDWVPEGTEDRNKVRFAGVMKARGLQLCENGSLGRILAFRISKGGLVSVQLPPLEAGTQRTQSTPTPLLILPRKRKAETDLEAEADVSGGGEASDDYGWDDEAEIPIEGLEAEPDESL